MKLYKIGGSSLDTLNKMESVLKIFKKTPDKKILVVSAIGRFPNPYATETLSKKCMNVNEVERDLLLSTGEIISAVSFSNYLNSKNLKSIVVSPYSFNLFSINKKYFLKLFKNYDVIILPGFIYTKGKTIYTLQRGGSTLSAAYFAKKFKLNLTIITDICGIYDKEPIDHNSKHIPLLSYKELIKLKSDTFFPKKAAVILNNSKLTTFFIKYDDQSKITKVIYENGFIK